MTTTVLRRPVDSYVVEDKPTRNNAPALRLSLSGLADHNELAYLFFGGGPRPGVFVVSATLSLYARGDWVGTPTLSVQRVIDPWREGTITFKNRPRSTATGGVSLAPGAVAGGDRLDFDVTTMVRTAYLGSGAPYYGFVISSTGTNERSVHSSEAVDPALRPTLTIVYSTAPTVPFDLVPGDGSVVSIPSPVLAWAQYDVDGDEQQAFEVQVDPAADESSPDFDSGWIVSADPELDLADTAFAGLSPDGSTQWRVRTQDSTGQESPWSEWATITRRVKGDLTIAAPTSLVEEATPEIVTTLADRNQASLSYTLEEQQPDGAWLETWSTGRFNARTNAGVAYSYEVPAADEATNARGRVVTRAPIRQRYTPYRLTVRAWDDEEGRVFTPGDPPWVEAQITFSWVDSVISPDSPSTLTVTQEPDGGPGVVLTWTRPAVPDYWAVMVDGRLFVDKVPALDWTTGVEEYGMTFYGVEPGSEHTIEVLALEVT